MAALDTQELVHIIKKYKPNLGLFEELYRDIHRNPELSCQESRTAGIVEDHLRSLRAYNVHTGIGGHGVVGVLQNGPGPIVLLRADMDALPVKEQTGLEYASEQTGTDVDGKFVHIMHACGHDMNMSPLLVVSKMMAEAKSHWSGTLIVLFQPSEELASGAQAMVDDGLYGDKFGIPVPDIVLGQHVLVLKTGTVGIAPGPIFAAVDSLSIRVVGRGGHGTRPDLCVDPVLTAAHIVIRLQSIITREVRPGEMAVLTCGSIQAGEAANIIPPYADIKVTMRTYKPEVHSRILESVHRVVQAECDADLRELAGCVQKPEIKTIMHAPATINDDRATATLTEAFRYRFGEACTRMEPNPGSEDVSVLARAVNKPYVYWLFGGVDEATWDRAVAQGKVEDIPYNHSPMYAPVIQPTLSTGVDALALAALTFLGRRPAIKE